MTPDTTKTQASTPPQEGEVCPHCGSVLDVARALEQGHSIAHPGARRLQADRAER